MGWKDKLNQAVDKSVAAAKDGVAKGQEYRQTKAQVREEMHGAPASYRPDLTDRKNWPNQGQLSWTVGVQVGPPEEVSTADSEGWRYTGSDERGSFVFELHHVRPESIAAAGGIQEWLEPRAEAHQHHDWMAFAEFGVVASHGDSYAACFANYDDQLFFATAQTPGVDMTEQVEQIIHKLFEQ